MPRTKRAGSTSKRQSTSSTGVEEDLSFQQTSDSQQESNQPLPLDTTTNPGGQATNSSPPANTNLKLKFKITGQGPSTPGGPVPSPTPTSTSNPPTPNSSKQQDMSDASLKIKIKMPPQPTTPGGLGEDLMDVDTTQSKQTLKKATYGTEDTTTTPVDTTAVAAPVAAPPPRKNKRKAAALATAAVASHTATTGPSTTPAAVPAPTLASSTSDLFGGDGMETDLDEADDANYNSDEDADLDARGRKKGASRSKAKSKRSTRPSKPKNEIDENYETVGSFEDDPHSAGHHAATILWRNVEAYFGEITSEDLSYLDACSDKPRDDDKAFIIPKLGTHYSAVPRPRMGSMGGLDQSEGWVGLTTDTSTRADTMLARILSALVEEGTFTGDMFSTDDLDTNASMDLAQLGGDDSANFQELELLDQRIQQELMAIGLLDEQDVIDNPKEDDEICAELRKLQAQLRTQIAVNAKMKKQFYEKALVAMEHQKEYKLKRQQLLEQEKMLLEKMKKFKKRKRLDEENPT